MTTPGRPLTHPMSLVTGQTRQAIETTVTLREREGETGERRLFRRAAAQTEALFYQHKTNFLSSP